MAIVLAVVAVIGMLIGLGATVHGIVCVVRNSLPTSISQAADVRRRNAGAETEPQ
jgi:hypothetical protein